MTTIRLFREFECQFDAAAKKREINLAQTNSLTKLRDTLLPKLLSGELRIPDAEKMVEELGLMKFTEVRLEQAIIDLPGKACSGLGTGL